MPSHPKDEPHPKFSHLPLATSGPMKCALTTLDEQVARAYQQYSGRNDALAKNTFMTSMKDQNEVLYYRLILDHLKEMFPIIYTPTEGDAIQNYSRLFRNPSGCFLSIDDTDGIDEALDKWGSADDIDLIVVSDGEQILGIGDQGVGGVLISIAKLVIYTLCAGVHPERTLPVILDCGTDNQELLNDDLYLGNRRPRVRGKEYDSFVDKFIHSARQKFPKAYLHCVSDHASTCLDLCADSPLKEDFGLHNARRILDLYRDKIPIFNDDVQGTGCVTLAALMAASHVSGVSLKDLRVLCFGAGSAGTGIADQIARAVAVESSKSLEEAAEHIWLVDKPGILLRSHEDGLTPAQRPYARADSEWSGGKHDDLLSIVKQVKPHVMIGTSTKPKAFTEEVVKEMAKHVDRPIILPLSNPTRLHEADPKDISAWTEGKALIATGSPFPPVEHNGTKHEISECNNSTIFPGISLGAILARARLMTDEMLVAATRALAKQAPALRDPNAGLLPDVVDVRELSVHVAAAVIKQTVKDGLNEQQDIPQDDAELEEWIREQMWEPRYRPLEHVGKASADKHARGEAGVSGGS